MMPTIGRIRSEVLASGAVRQTCSIAAGVVLFLSISVSAAGPIFEEAKLIASDFTSEGTWGVSVDIDGNTAVVGAPIERAAYVYTRSGTTWTQEAKLGPRGHPSADYFGWAVAVDGDTVAVGAFHDKGSQGSVYVFTSTKNGWVQQAKLTASDGTADDFFGFSVALDGDTLVVGASSDSVNFDNQGSAYVFTRSGKKWTEEAKLVASDPAYLDLFGSSVAVDGDTALVGAFRDTVTFGGQGSAYVFTRSGTSWSQEAKLAASDGGFLDFFGVSVALQEDTAVVGASNHNVGSNVDQGAAYVFTRVGTAWSQEAKLTALAGAAGDDFGLSVAVEGDTAVIGAWFHDVGTALDQGAVYVFTRSGATWTEQPEVSPTDGAAGDVFGRSVAIDSGTVVASAPGADLEGAPEQGAAYVFTGFGQTASQSSFQDFARQEPKK